MSGQEGLQRLASYLEQTRRQAVASIDVLNARITELNDDVETQKNVSLQMEKERDYYRNLVEQMKLEGTRKWAFQERDDWKALLESTQEDRLRLQEEVDRLTAELQVYRGEDRLENNGSPSAALSHLYRPQSQYHHSQGNQDVHNDRLIPTNNGNGQDDANSIDGEDGHTEDEEGGSDRSADSSQEKRSTNVMERILTIDTSGTGANLEPGRVLQSPTKGMRDGQTNQQGIMGWFFAPQDHKSRNKNPMMYI